MGCTGRAFQDSIKSFNGNSVLHLLFYLHSFTFVLLPTSCAVSLRKKDSDLVPGGVMNSSIAPIGIARRMILAIVTSREIYPGNFEWIQRAKLFRGFKR